uniref:G_PROTEIN_RECEP_F1_2 domain-containing protein n=1 Tax=Panagrellus redivivus TaxID=6233 RepID=A0A7E4V4B8_PANRE
MSLSWSSTQMTPKGTPPEGREWIPAANFTKGMDTLVAYHTVNTALGAVCAVIAGINLIIFLGSPKFRRVYKMLTVLAIADLLNTIAMMFMGINRVQMYSAVLETLSIPIRTSWDCAIEPWLWLKGIGEHSF